jgi:glycosylphosphatidylinositol transamidase (GPIT) subunit GPI8
MTTKELESVFDEIKEAGTARGFAIVRAATNMYPHEGCDEAGSKAKLGDYLRVRGYNLDPRTSTLSDFYNVRSLADSMMMLLMCLPDEVTDEPWYEAWNNVFNWAFDFIQEQLGRCVEALDAEDCDEARMDCEWRE